MTSFRRRFIIDSGIIAGSMACAAIAIFFADKLLLAESEKIFAARSRNIIAHHDQEIFAILKRDASSVEEYQQKVARLLPEKDQMLYLGEWLETMGRVYRTDVAFTLTGDQLPTPLAPGVVTFRISVRGKYENAAGLLKNIEANHDRFLIGLDTLEFQEIGRSGDYEIGTQGRAFYK